jgi:hypothetical protein
MSVIPQSLTLADGRVVEVFLSGDPTGYPLVMHHGHPRTHPPSQTGARPARYEVFD